MDEILARPAAGATQAVPPRATAAPTRNRQKALPVERPAAAERPEPTWTLAAVSFFERIGELAEFAGNASPALLNDSSASRLDFMAVGEAVRVVEYFASGCPATWDDVRHAAFDLEALIAAADTAGPEHVPERRALHTVLLQRLDGILAVENEAEFEATGVRTVPPRPGRDVAPQICRPDAGELVQQHAQAAGHTPYQLIMVLEAVAGTTRTLHQLLARMQEETQDQQLSVLTDTAVALAIHIGGMADNACHGGSVIGSYDDWNFGSVFKEARAK